MKTGKTKLWLFSALLILCLMSMGKPAQAASYRQIAYVNSTNHSLVLKFKNFCSAGYTWKVTKDSASSAVLTGSESGGTVGSSRMIKIPLGSAYAAKTKYTLMVTGKDKKQSITVRYYTGSALTKAKVSRTAKNAMKAEAKVSKGFKGNCVEFLVFRGEHSTDLITRMELKKKKSSGKTTTMTASIPGAKISNGDYKTYIVLNYTFDGNVYYGQGKPLTCKFIKKQAKVTGLKASTQSGKVRLSWNPTADATYYKVYQSVKKSGSYKCISSRVDVPYYETSSLKGGKTYYYKVMAVGEAGKKIVKGEKSKAVAVKVPVVPGKVGGIRFALNSKEELIVKWNTTVNTTGFIVLYKKAKDKVYKQLGKTKNRSYSLSSLDGNTSYDIKVQAYQEKKGIVTKSDYTSAVLRIKPKEYVKKNRSLLLANGVRPIEHVNGKSIYTTKKYSNEVKLAFANAKGYSSTTNYLIWISHYTQQVVVYQGSAGHWKIIKSFPCASGKASTPSPKGVFKVTYKETGWYYVNTKELYVTHWCGRNSFHTRPLYNDGSVCTATMGKPASHGCARLLNNDAWYIYKNIPVGTTVVSY